jgi:hypothetical protein
MAIFFDTRREKPIGLWFAVFAVKYSPPHVIHPGKPMVLGFLVSCVLCYLFASIAI